MKSVRTAGRRKAEVPNRPTKVSLPPEMIEWLESMGGLRRYLIAQFYIYQKAKAMLWK